MPLLRVENLTFHYGNNTVLKDISLEVDSGDFLGLLGPNGSGKTTLLKCISGVKKPTGGSVFLEGRRLQEFNRREIAQVIAVVPQGVEAGFEFSVREFVMMGRTPYIKPLGRASRYDISIVRQAMESTGVLCLADRNFGELSGGEKQRVVIAQALVQQPKLLLLDEPASYLDISHEMEIFDLIREINSKHRIAVMVVLHDLNMASRYCKSLVLLRQGTVFAKGSPKDILTTQNIREVYHAEVEVVQSNGKDIIVPLSSIQGEVSC